jgi:hypothetical protein
MQWVHIDGEQDEDLIQEEADEPTKLVEIELRLQQAQHYEVKQREKHSHYYLCHDVYKIKGGEDLRCYWAK